MIIDGETYSRLCFGVCDWLPSTCSAVRASDVRGNPERPSHLPPRKPPTCLCSPQPPSAIAMHNTDGFFAAAPVNIANTHDADGFAQAIAARFGATNANQLTARLHSPALALPTPSARPMNPPLSLAASPTRKTSPTSTNASPAPPPTSTAPALPPSSFTALAPAELASAITDSNTLILDIRPHAAYTQARVRTAISLSVPSTLLKRPLFSLARLTDMLPSSSARRNFRKWKDKSRIVVYDLDSLAVKDGSNILGLMRKFAGEGMDPASVCWLTGGFQAVWREKRDMIDQDPLPEEPDDADDDEGDHLLPQPTPPTLTTPGAGFALSLPGTAKSKSASAAMPVLRTKHLPMAAFTLSTTTSCHGSATSPRGVNRDSNSPPSRHPFAFSLPSHTHGQSKPSTQAFNPFFDAIRQNIELSQGITDRIPLVLPRAVRKRVRRGDLGVTVENGVGWQWLEAIAWKAGKSGGSSTDEDADEEMGDAEEEEKREREKWTTSREGSKGAGTGESDSEGSSRTDGGSEDERLGKPGNFKSGSQQSSSTHSYRSSARYQLPEPSSADVEEGTQELAMQFYKIELAEQRRLMGVMEHHSREGAGGSDNVNLNSSTPATSPSGSSEGGGSPGEGIGGAVKEVVVKERDFAGGLISSQEVRKRYTEGRRRGGSLGSGSSGGHVPTSGSSGGHVPTSGSGESSLVGSTSVSVSGREAEVGGSTTAVSASASSAGEGRKEKVPVEGVVPVLVSSGVSETSGGSESGRSERRKRKERERKQVFPFSITAGVEKGAKNRYRNIWPFEHTRVKLRSKPGAFTAASTVSSVSSRSQATPGFGSSRGINLTLGGGGHGSAGGKDAFNAFSKDNASNMGFVKEEVATPLSTSSSIVDDYVNASYVQPLGTRKRYIATQGPLEATFGDFWTLCWEQNVHVIVMLTREIEGMMEKSGKYWQEGTFGPLVLRLIESSGTPQEEKKPFGFFGGAKNETGFFPPVEKVQKAEKEKASTVRRVFELRNKKYPEAGGRIVTQLQYLDWPDMNVPDDPHGVLDLIEMMNKEVERSVEAERRRQPFAVPESYGHARSTSSRESSAEKNDLDPKTGIVRRVLETRNPPVLLHCSAGVGRTGGYIIVDAVLDGLKRELRKRREAEARRVREEEEESASMDVDGDDGVYSKDAPMDVDISSPVPVSIVSSAYHAASSMSPDSGPSTSPPLSVSVSPPPAMSSPAFPPSLNMREDSRHTVRSFSEKAPLVFGGPIEADPRVRTYSAPAGLPEVRPVGPAHAYSSYESRRPQGIKSPSLRAEFVASPEVMANSPEAEAARLNKSGPGLQASAARLPAGGAKPPHSLSVDSQSSKSSSIFTSNDDVRNPWDRSSTSLTSALSSAAYPESMNDSSEPGAKPVEKYRPMDTPGTVREVQAKANAPDFFKPSTFDYMRPRKLHQDDSPPLLSSYKDPIRTVVEDMREQRMSLCQSLRQYVFVHRAIIEGALRVVDKEKELYPEESELERGRSDTERHAIRKDFAPTGRLLSPASALDGMPHRLATLQSSPTKHKRLASPTELIKEGKEGQLRLAKRPSVKKRKAISSDEAAEFASDTPEAKS
ncbi:hypothetical protein OE88DRAFT_165616 [Heliocybe sulcata]|uniref:protein-tyrosine-phosphatase n=1 Tax=Heliocybe sulcata TaxID=5364 RepID=A0A5C3NLE8_9AGAM|nr:hypothetical protein OE88DRAFT_165616 [Heliocybe sulcata]